MPKPQPKTSQFHFPAMPEIGGGERVVLQGKSGSGKTLLLRHWAETHSEATYLPQKPFFVPGSVEQNLRLPFEFRIHRHRHFNLNRIKGWLEPFGLSSGLLNQKAETLSGGESQVFHLLRTLQLEPELLLLDEPTAALDGLRTLAFENLLLEWLKENSMRRLIMVSHDPDQGARFATRILRLENGELKEPPTEDHFPNL